MWVVSPQAFIFLLGHLPALEEETLTPTQGISSLSTPYFGLTGPLIPQQPKEQEF